MASYDTKDRSRNESNPSPHVRVSGDQLSKEQGRNDGYHYRSTMMVVPVELGMIQHEFFGHE